MTGDASLPPNASVTNGTLTPSAHGHGEADASSHPTSAPHPPMQSLREVCADIHSRVSAFLNAPAEDQITRSTQEQTKIGIGVIEKALEDYEFERLSLSYNGGKDCLVLLLLYLSVLHTHFTRRRPSRRKNHTEDATYDTPTQTQEQEQIETFPTTIPSIYAKPPDPFPLVTSFVASSSARYHLSLIHISTSPGSGRKSNSHSSPPPSTVSHNQNPVITFRDAFALYLSHHHPSCRAIFVGTRRTDPHGATLAPFQLTDGLWPRFMRIHPVLDFSLAQVWTFLRHPSIRDGEGFSEKSRGQREVIDYCKMYDQGYTSLGGVNDTHRNPKLRDEGYESGYKPAWTMTEDVEERAGRE